MGTGLRASAGLLAVAAASAVETRRIADVCGVASGENGFFASDGKGRIWRDGEVVSRRDDVQWDNHLAVAGPAGRVEPAG